MKAEYKSEIVSDNDKAFRKRHIELYEKGFGTKKWKKRDLFMEYVKLKINKRFMFLSMFYCI